METAAIHGLERKRLNIAKKVFNIADGAAALPLYFELKLQLACLHISAQNTVNAFHLPSGARRRLTLISAGSPPPTPPPPPERGADSFARLKVGSMAANTFSHVCWLLLLLA
jgi:hypothetical protein